MILIFGFLIISMSKPSVPKTPPKERPDKKPEPYIPKPITMPEPQTDPYTIKPREPITTRYCAEKREYTL